MSRQSSLFLTVFNRYAGFSSLLGKSLTRSAGSGIRRKRMKPEHRDRLWVGGVLSLTTYICKKDSALPRQVMSRNEYGTIAQAGCGLSPSKNTFI